MADEMDIASASFRATGVGAVLAFGGWYVSDWVTGIANSLLALGVWVGVVLLILGLNGLTIHGLKVLFGEESFF